MIKNKKDRDKNLLDIKNFIVNAGVTDEVYLKDVMNHLSELFNTDYNTITGLLIYFRKRKATDLNLIIYNALREAIDLPDISHEIRARYVSETYNPVIYFNSQRFYCIK